MQSLLKKIGSKVAPYRVGFVHEVSGEQNGAIDAILTQKGPSPQFPYWILGGRRTNGHITSFKRQAWGGWM